MQSASKRSLNEFIIKPSRVIRAKITLTSGTVAASVFRRAAGSVLACALLRAVFPEGVHGAKFAAILTAISGCADASAVDG